MLDGGACVREGLNELEDDVGEELGDGFFLLAAGGFHDLWVCGCGCVGDHIKRVSEMKDVCIHVHVCVRVRVCVYIYIDTYLSEKTDRAFLDLPFICPHPIKQHL